MDKFLTLNYYFNPNPGSSFKYGVVLLVFTGILFLIAFLIKAYRKRTEDKILKKMFKPYPSKLIWFALVGSLMVLLRWEAVTLLSMRFWWIVYFGLLIYSIIINTKRFYREYPRKVKQSSFHQEESKYIPTKKKRRK